MIYVDLCSTDRAIALPCHCAAVEIQCLKTKNSGKSIENQWIKDVIRFFQIALMFLFDSQNNSLFDSLLVRFPRALGILKVTITDEQIFHCIIENNPYRCR